MNAPLPSSCLLVIFSLLLMSNVDAKLPDFSSIDQNCTTSEDCNPLNNEVCSIDKLTATTLKCECGWIAPSLQTHDQQSRFWLTPNKDKFCLGATGYPCGEKYREFRLVERTQSHTTCASGICDEVLSSCGEFGFDPNSFNSANSVYVRISLIIFLTILLTMLF